MLKLIDIASHAVRMKNNVFIVSNYLFTYVSIRVFFFLLIFIFLGLIEEIQKLKVENGYLNDIINNSISEIKQILELHTKEFNNINNKVDGNRQIIVSQ